MRLLFMLVCWLGAFFPISERMAFAAAPLRVVTSFTIPADWVRQVGGKHVSVVSLVPANSDPHAYEPTPADLRKLHEADLVVALHPSLETWFSSLIASDTLRKKTLYLGQPWLSGQEHPATCHSHDHDHSGHHHTSSKTDPHLWMDPLLVVSMVEQLATRLAQADPANARHYADAAQKYGASLRELDTWARQTLATVPPPRRILLSHHDNLRRMADRYDLKVAGTLLDNTSTEAPDPAAGKLSALIRLARQAKVPLFYDNTSNKNLVTTVTRDAGLPPPVLLYTDALDAPPGPASTYLGMYRENIRRIAEALR